MIRSHGFNKYFMMVNYKITYFIPINSTIIFNKYIKNYSSSHLCKITILYNYLSYKHKY